MGNLINTGLDSLISKISASYSEHPYSSSDLPGNLPSRDVVIQITELLLELLYPEYFGRQNLGGASLRYHIGDLIVTIDEKLKKQVSRALKHEIGKSEAFDSIDISARAEEISNCFLNKIPKIREYLAADVQAAFDGDPAAHDKDEVISSYPGAYAISVYRLSHELYELNVPLIPRIMSEYAHGITGVDIHSGAKIGKYFFIDHGTGVVIGETTVIGNNVKIYQGVTLGALSTRGGQSLRNVRRHPTLEDDVTVYSGASILGGNTIIGKGCVIGSNVFITQSVPADTKVSIKNPDLLFKGYETAAANQELVNDWCI